MPFSISAGVGFIALFGIAVLNGIILISFFNELKHEEGVKDIRQRVLKGTKLRLRPVILTAATDILGFFPMAFSTSAGAEVQRPLATVVIGGLFTSTFLTLIVLPVIYYIFDEMDFNFSKLLKKPQFAVFIILPLIFMGKNVTAQDKQTINLDEAIRIAIENNAGLNADRMEITRNEKLIKTSFDPGPTMLFYGNEENDFQVEDDGIVSYGLQQNISFPTVYAARGKINQQNVENSRYYYALNEFNLRKDVSQAYYQLIYQKQRLNLVNFLDSLYNEFMLAANRRFELGETGRLEKITAQSRLMEIRALKNQAEQDINFALQQLKGFLQIDQPVAVPDDSLYQVEVDVVAFADHSSEIPAVDYYQGLQELSQKQLMLEKNQLLPGFNLQYFKQTIASEPGFAGYQVGMNIPIWFRPQQGRIQSAEIQTEITSERTANYLNQLQAKHGQVTALLAKYQQYISYYESQGLDMARELIEIAESSYREGETGYLQYLQSIEQSIRIRISYLENLNQYNQAAFELKYLQL